MWWNALLRFALWYQGCTRGEVPFPFRIIHSRTDDLVVSGSQLGDPLFGCSCGWLESLQNGHAVCSAQAGFDEIPLRWTRGFRGS